MKIPFIAAGKGRVPLILLLVLLILSMVTVFFAGPDRKILLFYPGDNITELKAELRNVPPQKGIEARMEQVVEELLLHPASVLLNPAVPDGVRVNFLIYDKSIKSVYLDLSSEMVIIDRANGEYPGDQAMLDIIEQNLMFHFPKLEQIQITIDSKVPFHPLYLENSNA